VWKTEKVEADRPFVSLLHARIYDSKPPTWGGEKQLTVAQGEETRLHFSSVFTFSKWKELWPHRLPSLPSHGPGVRADCPKVCGKSPGLQGGRGEAASKSVSSHFCDRNNSYTLKSLLSYTFEVYEHFLCWNIYNQGTIFSTCFICFVCLPAWMCVSVSVWVCVCVCVCVSVHRDQRKALMSPLWSLPYTRWALKIQLKLSGMVTSTPPRWAMLLALIMILAPPKTLPNILVVGHFLIFGFIYSVGETDSICWDGTDLFLKNSLIVVWKTTGKNYLYFKLIIWSPGLILGMVSYGKTST